MSRRRRHHKHEEHGNHEAWAIPYGDLVTLLLAFFVVMYAISSVNEGKYRVLSDSLVAAFRGTPKAIDPVQAGAKTVGEGGSFHQSIIQQLRGDGAPRSLIDAIPIVLAAPDDHTRALRQMAEDLERSMGPLIDSDLVSVRRHANWIEVEIKADMLFPSGVSALSATAQPVMTQLAASLAPFPNPIRVEGYTDDKPIRTLAFPSNWELSAARAASVVHLLTDNGLDPARLSVMAFGQYRPLQPNETDAGRNANRRVVLVILSSDGSAPIADSVAPESTDVAPPDPAIPAPASPR